MIVSIITPVLNGGPLLGECIASVQAEARALRAKNLDIEIEHVIADGGSTDGSIELARSHDVTLVCEKGTDLHDRINRHTFASRGELVGLLGADDVLVPGAIEAVVAAYRSSGRPWVVGDVRWIDPDGRSLGTLHAPPTWISPKLYACLGWNLASPLSTYYARDFFISLGGFDPRFRISADYDLFTRALSVAPFARANHVVAGFRRRGKNMSVVGKDISAEENRRIQELLGPTSAIARTCARLALKTWINARHPGWFLRKLLNRTQVRLGVRTFAYYD